MSPASGNGEDALNGSDNFQQSKAASRPLNGGGESGEEIRAADWSCSELGTPASWSVSLRVQVQLLLNMQTPMLLLWGGGQATFCNDAFRNVAAAAGCVIPSAGQCWTSTDAFTSIANRIVDGEPVVLIHAAVLFGERESVPDDARQFSMSAVANDEGDLAGVLIAADFAGGTPGRGINPIIESESRFRYLVEEAPVAMAVFRGPNHVIELANAAQLRIWEREAAAVLGRPLFEAIPEARDQGFEELLGCVLSTGEPCHVNGLSAPAMRNGRLEQVFFNYIYQPLRQPDGAIEGVMVAGIDITEQVEDRRRIEKSEALQELLSNSVPAMIFYIDHEERYRLYNNTFKEWFGVVDDAALGVCVRDFLGEKAYANAQPYLLKAYDGARVQYEVPAPTRINPDRWLSVVYTPHKLADGSVAGVIVHATDITHRKEVEFALKKSESRFRNLIRQAPVATALLSGRELVVTLANDAMLRSWNRDREVIGMAFIEALPQMAGSEFLARAAQVFDTGEAIDIKGSPLGLQEQGSTQTRYFDYSLTPLRNEQGAIAALIHIAIDVTAQVQATREIAAKEAELRGAIELAELGTWNLDLASGKVAWSERFAEIHGLTGAASDIEALLHNIIDADRERVRKTFFETLGPESTGQYKLEYSIINIVTDRRHTLQATGQLTLNDEGIPAAISGTVRDITLQREQQSALESMVQQRTEELAAAVEALQVTNEELAASNVEMAHSNEELAQYAYVASHDLQEPLRKIRVFTNMLQSNEETAASNRPVIQKIGSSAERMSLLIQDLLAFSRLLKSDSLMRPVDLNQVVRAVWDDFELLAAETGAGIELGELPVVEAVSLQMNQLFYNLISNALKFISPARLPHISIHAARISPEEVSMYIKRPLAFSAYYRITLSDNGIGFEAQYNEQIFDVFKRLHSREHFPGSGIGLALCRRIAVNHNGVLYASSEPDRGSSFHMLLPERQHDVRSVFGDEPMSFPT